MRPKLVLAVIYLLISTAFSNCLASEDELDIITVSLAGISSADPRKSQEYLFLDDLYRLLESRFDGRMNYKEASPNRIISTLENSKNVACIINLKNSTYSALDYYIPLGPAVGMSVIFKKNRSSEFPIIDGVIDLSKLVQSPILRGAAVSGRPCPDVVSSIITQGVELGSIKVFNTSSYGTNVISMVGLGRLDYVIDYSSIIDYMPDRYSLESSAIMQNIDQNQIGLYCAGGSLADRSRIVKKLNSTAIALALEADSYKLLYSKYNAGAQRDRLLKNLDGYLATRSSIMIEKRK